MRPRRNLGPETDGPEEGDRPAPRGAILPLARLRRPRPGLMRLACRRDGPKLVRQLQHLRDDLLGPPTTSTEGKVAHGTFTAAALHHQPEPSSVAFTPDPGCHHGPRRGRPPRGPEGSATHLPSSLSADLVCDRPPVSLGGLSSRTLRSAFPPRRPPPPALQFFNGKGTPVTGRVAGPHVPVVSLENDPRIVALVRADATFRARRLIESHRQTQGLPADRSAGPIHNFRGYWGPGGTTGFGGSSFRRGSSARHRCRPAGVTGRPRPSSRLSFGGDTRSRSPSWPANLMIA